MAIQKVPARAIESSASSANLSIDAGTLYLDASNNRVGIGTNSPTTTLDIASKVTINAANAYGKINIARATDNGLSALYIQGADNAGTANELSLVNSGGGGAAINITGGDLRFYASSNTTERMRIDSSGNVGIGGTATRGILDIFGGRVNIRGNSSDSRAFITLGDATYTSATIAAAYGGELTLTGTPVNLASGQLKFPASQNASSDANTLDDYEEGTWTAVPTWATQGTGSGNITGLYTKIGNTVNIHCYPTAVKGTASGAFKITGLPFTPAQNTACSVRADAAGAASKVLQCVTVGTEIRFTLMNQSTTYGADLTATDMNAACYINIQCTYQI